MKLQETIKDLIFELYDKDKLREKFVINLGMSDNDFETIFKVSDKVQFQAWMLNKVHSRIIKMEDVYKFKDYFDIFKKYVAKYPIKDINQIKTKEDVETFIKLTQEIREKNIKFSPQQTDDEKIDRKNYVSTNDMEKLDDVGIKFLGMVEGYQIFKVPMELKGNTNAFTTYKNILGKCAGRDQGAKIDICTMASESYFDDYLNDGPYYVLFNLGDNASPYQFHYESEQFMDKNDKRLF